MKRETLPVLRMLGPETQYGPVTPAGHAPGSEGYGLAWSTQRPGLLASGSFDQRVVLWDVPSTNCQPLRLLERHTGALQPRQ